MNLPAWALRCCRAVAHHATHPVVSVAIGAGGGAAVYHHATHAPAVIACACPGVPHEGGTLGPGYPMPYLYGLQLFPEGDNAYGLDIALPVDQGHAGGFATPHADLTPWAAPIEAGLFPRSSSSVLTPVATETPGTLPIVSMPPVSITSTLLPVTVPEPDSAALLSVAAAAVLLTNRGRRE